MKFGVLGPLRIEEAHVSYVPSAPKQRQVLALLLVNANQIVSTSLCLEELWSRNPPKTALTTLQCYVMQIRKTLARVPSIGSAAAARQRLSTRGTGYLLAAAADQSDLGRFEQLVRDSRRAVGERDDRRAAGLLRAALDLWEGPMLADVGTGRVLDAETARVEQRRLTVLEQWIDAELRLGNHHDLVSELTALVWRYPTNENLAAQCMIALYRSGRQTEALAVFGRLRRILDEELGVRPLNRLLLLYRAMLSADPVLDTPAPGASRLSLDLVCGAAGPRPAPRTSPSLTVVRD